MSKIVSALLMAVLFLGGTSFVSEAQTTGTNLQAQLELLAKLQAQIRELQAQLQSIQTQRAQVISELVSTLRQGSQGDQVTALQALLAADPEIYPEGLLTGFFGPATGRAVKRFQSKHGLPSVGIVGPLTRGKLNAMLKNTPISFETAQTAGVGGATSTATSTPGRLCAIVPPGHLIAPGWLRKQGGVAPIVPPCQVLPPGIAMKLGLTTSTPPTPPPPAPTSTPDVVPPILSGITAAPATSTAAISWTTNELADSQVMYGATSSYGSSTALNVTLLTFHSQTLTGLTSATMYHFQALSKDAAGNLATSSDQVFTTTALDLTPPAISGVGVSAASTTATVSWTTNELGTSKVYYGTTSPVDLASTSTLMVANASLVTSHTLGLTGLTASSTYYFVAESADASGNVATSTEQSFPTTP